MKFIAVISFAAVALAQSFALCDGGVVDPTTICMPDTLQLDYYDSKTLETGTVAADYPNEKVSMTYERTGKRIVLDLGNELSYTIDSDGSCTQEALHPFVKMLYFQCLPATARLTGAPDRLGSGTKSMEIQTWTMDIAGPSNRVIYVFNTDSPAILVMRQVIIGNEDQGLFVTSNASLTVDPSLLNIPASCQSQSAV